MLFGIGVLTHSRREGSGAGGVRQLMQGLEEGPLWSGQKQEAIPLVCRSVIMFHVLPKVCEQISLRFLVPSEWSRTQVSPISPDPLCKVQVWPLLPPRSRL